MPYLTRRTTPRASIFSCLVTLIVIIVCSSSSSAVQNQTLGSAMRAQDAKAGTLLLKTSGRGQMLPAPILATDVDIQVTGMIARSTVTQHFGNPTDEWLEGIYVFPLPESAAVDTLYLKIGERVIVGEIEERAEAKKIYEKAKKEGKKASLLEQERPNIFTTSVANVGPGEFVSVTIEYQEDLRYDQGEFSLRFPMVVGPRYIPGAQTISNFSPTGWSQDTDQVPDASRITPPVIDAPDSLTNPVRISVHIDAGFPVKVQSPSHGVQVRHNKSGTEVTLDETQVPADSDFVIEWRPEIGSAPNAALFSSSFQGDTYALLMLMPPNANTMNTERLPRETVFVIDTSSSMSGASLPQAKEALILALRRLSPEDTFNLIQFNSNSWRLWGSSQPATQNAIEEAVRYVRNLSANGGTEIMPALRLALQNQSESSRVRQVIFITDGAVGNEAELFGYIKTNLAQSRLFTIGIGSAPNSHFMTKAAEYGLGTYTYINSYREVQKKMGELFSKLESPLLTDIVINWQGQTVEHYPKYIPDLYLGEPIVLAAKLPSLGNDVEIRGYQGAIPWSIEFQLQGGRSHNGIDRLFGRRKIDALTARRFDGMDAEVLRDEIVGIALRHRLVSQHTSLVAVEQAISRSPDDKVHSSIIPTNLPKGWIMEDIWSARDQWSKERTALQEQKELARNDLKAQSEHSITGTGIELLRTLREELRSEATRRQTEKADRASAPDSDAWSASSSFSSSKAGFSSDSLSTPRRTVTAQGPNALPQTGTGAVLFVLIGLLLLSLALGVRIRLWRFV